MTALPAGATKDSLEMSSVARDQATTHRDSMAELRGPWPRWAIGLLIFLLLAGAGIRVRQFAARQSFWNDEAFIVLNVLDRTPMQLLGRLEYDQAAPPIFLWIERAMAVRWGANEYALRALALTCGILTLLFFARVCRLVLPVGPALGGLGFLVFCDKLVQYCVEVKQYSGDAMVAAILLLVAIRGRERKTPGRQLLEVAIVAALAVWFSHTAAIVFGGISLTLLVLCWREQGLRGLLVGCAANLLVAASLGALYFVSIRHQHTEFLYTFWADDFPDFAHPLRLPEWLVRHIYRLFDFPYPFAGAIVLGLAVLGTGWLARTGRRDVAGFCIMPIVLTAAAALVRQYPLSASRLTLFLIPEVLLLAGAGVAMIHDMTARQASALRYAWLAAAAAPLLILGISEQGYRLGAPRFRSHIRPAVEYVRAHRQAGDAIYLAGAGKLPAANGSKERHVEFLCYWRRPDPPFYLEWSPAAEIPHHRFWLVFPFKPKQGKRLTDALLKDAESVADQRAHFVSEKGGAAYLFERH